MYVKFHIIPVVTFYYRTIVTLKTRHNGDIMASNIIIVITIIITVAIDIISVVINGVVIIIFIMSICVGDIKGLRFFTLFVPPVSTLLLSVTFLLCRQVAAQSLFVHFTSRKMSPLIYSTVTDFLNIFYNTFMQVKCVCASKNHDYLT